MAPHAYWKGYLKLSLVSCPIALYPATSERLGAVSSDSFTASAAITGWQAHAMTGAEARLQDAWRGFVKTKVPWSKEGVNR